MSNLRNKRGKTQASTPSRQKTERLDELISRVEANGVKLRKEKLKQGFGWKCLSGACFLKGQAVLFLDSKMSIDEQIDFLSSWLAGASQEHKSAA